VVEERLAGGQRVHIHLICLFILGGFDLVVQCSVMNFWQPIQGADTKIDWDFLIGTLFDRFLTSMKSMLRILRRMWQEKENGWVILIWV
jgi:hypothetical protein